MMANFLPGIFILGRKITNVVHFLDPTHYHRQIIFVTGFFYLQLIDHQSTIWAHQHLIAIVLHLITLVILLI